MRLIITLLLVTAVAVPTALAETATDPSTGVVVPAWSPSGADLSAESVTASIGGAAAPVLSVLGPKDDLVLMVVLDLAGDLALVDTAREALIEKISGFADNHYVAVLSAQDGLRVLAEPTGDREKVATAIRSQQVGGRAGLLNTVQTVAYLGDSIEAKSGVRMAVLYITDSDIANYREDYTNPVVNSSDSRDLSRRFSDGLVKERISRIVAGLNSTQTPLFIVHLDYRTDRLNEAYQTGLLELARATGGDAWFARSQSGIPNQVASAVDRAADLWSVRVGLPDPDARQFEVTLLAPDEGILEYRSRFQLSAN